jgi:hypothetical protein
MDADQLSELRRVDREELTRHYRDAAIAALHAKSNDSDIDRWPTAARTLCQFLDFIQTEDALWSGLRQAVETSDGRRQDLEITLDRLEEFTDVEFDLLVRAGVDKDTAGRIVCDIRERLRPEIRVTQNDIGDMRRDIESIQGYLCGVDFAIYGQPEREAQNFVNTNAILAGGGGLVATVTNALAPLFPPFVAGSVLGGLAAAVGGFRVFRRR